MQQSIRNCFQKRQLLNSIAQKSWSM